ncbi:hypothetical protein E4U14_005444 [Claviceps sp. LM454 group G7]|nr:hypothetical protein E4U14_005444 [Claviceps sp. LM454 group G7]
MSPSSAREDTGLRQGFNGDAQLLEFPIDNSENIFPGGWSGFPLLEQQDPSQMALKNCKIDPNLPLPGSNPLSTPASHMWLPPSEVSPGTIPPYQPLPMAATRSTPSMCTPSMPGFATTPSASVQMQTVAPQMLQYSRSTPGLNSATATSGMDTNGFIQDGTDLLKIEEDLYAAPTPRPIQFMGAVAHEAQRSTKKRPMSTAPMTTTPKSNKRRKTSKIPLISITNDQASLVNNVIEAGMTRAYEAGCKWSFKHTSSSLQHELKNSGSLAGHKVMLQGDQVTQDMKDTVARRLNEYLGRAKAHSPKDQVLDAIHNETRSQLHDLGIVAFAHS